MAGTAHHHHVTGRRAPDAPYLDDAFTVPLSPRSHAETHVALRCVGLDFPCASADLLLYRRRRAAAQFRLWAGAGTPVTLAPAALFVLADIVDGA